MEVEQTVQPAITNLESLPQLQQWRARFFAHWRLWPKNAAERDYRLGLLPADTRIPDHTIWNHMQIVSALAGCQHEDGSAVKPAFLKVQIGPVQDFIAQARSTRDLWSGSYLLSWLMTAGLKALSGEIGPDAVVFPNLRGQPLFDLQWRDEVWKKVRIGKTTVWIHSITATGICSRRIYRTCFSLLSPRLAPLNLERSSKERSGPNGRPSPTKFGLFATARPVEQTRIKSPRTKARSAERNVRSASGRKRSGFLRSPGRQHHRPETLDATLALAGGFAPDMPSQQARKRVEAVMQMATVQMPVDHRDVRYYIDSARPA